MGRLFQEKRWLGHAFKTDAIVHSCEQIRWRVHEQENRLYEQQSGGVGQVTVCGRYARAIPIGPSRRLIAHRLQYSWCESGLSEMERPSRRWNGIPVVSTL